MMTKSFDVWKLMDEAIPNEHLKKMSDFIMSGSKLTYGENIKKFEKMWSEWQGCKYSVFCNSGSSANFLAVNALEEGHGSALWVSQACTWSTTVSPILLRGDNLQLCDVNLQNFGPDLDNLEHIFKTQKPKYLILVHLLGFDCYSEELKRLCENYDVRIMEDCCEAHGANHNGVKVGNFGDVSTFSFYYGHHMTTIEGGMVCTDDEEVYERLLLLRSHGLLRELPESNQKKYKDQEVDPSFTFMIPGFNMRSTELNAILGMEQIKDLDEKIAIRNKNFSTFISRLNPEKYITDFDYEGCSNFCFPIIRKDDRVSEVKSKLIYNNIHIRPIIAGSLYEHPFMKNVNMFQYDTNSNYIHHNGLYVGNNHKVNEDMVLDLVTLLDEV